VSKLTNPVFQEGVQIYLAEGQGFMVYFFFLVILALLQFLALILPAGDPQFWLGPAYLFKFSSVAALLLMVYFGLRLANQEFVPWKFQPLKHWFQQEQLNVSGIALGQILLVCLHVLIFILLSFPLLGWSGAIARAPAASIMSTLLLLFFYSLTYSVWGCLVLLSGLLYLPLNPVAYLLHHLGGLELGAPLALWRWRLDALVVHFLFHIFLLALSFLVYWWTLKRLKESYS
jgi:hypothetical protein